MIRVYPARKSKRQAAFMGASARDRMVPMAASSTGMPSSGLYRVEVTVVTTSRRRKTSCSKAAWSRAGSPSQKPSRAVNTTLGLYTYWPMLAAQGLAVVLAGKDGHTWGSFYTNL